MDVPGWLKPPLWGLMFVIEIAGLLIRHVVLAVRLFANMFAGHVVLSVILGLHPDGLRVPAFYLVRRPASSASIAAEPPGAVRRVLAGVIFTFLSALFIGSAVHPH